jgi:hypothetical protein
MLQRLFAVLALLFFCLPVGLRAVGVTANPFENRRLADPPKVSAGWDAFDQATRFFVDRLPLREQAVEANTWVALHLWDSVPDYGRRSGREADALPFGQPDTAAPPGGGQRAPDAAPGNAQQVQGGLTVLRGKDGWLYLEDELGRACTTFSPWPVVMRRYQRVVDLLRAHGKRAIVVVPPDKSTIYPEFLPDSYKEKDCAGPGREAAWKALGSAPGVLGLRDRLLATKTPPPEESYWPNDTHWNTKGATIGTRAVLERLGTRVRMRDDEIERTRSPHQGDLANLLGVHEEVESPTWTVKRPIAPGTGRDETMANGSVIHVSTQPAGGAPLLAGRTVFLYDSFGIGMLGALAPYMRELRSLQWFLAKDHEDLIEAMATADTVILEKVERDANYLASDGGVLTPDFLTRLRARLERGP